MNYYFFFLIFKYLTRFSFLFFFSFYLLFSFPYFSYLILFFLPSFTCFLTQFLSFSISFSFFIRIIRHQEMQFISLVHCHPPSMQRVFLSLTTPHQVTRKSSTFCSFYLLYSFFNASLFCSHFALLHSVIFIVVLFY